MPDSGLGSEVVPTFTVQVAETSISVSESSTTSAVTTTESSATRSELAQPVLVLPDLRDPISGGLSLTGEPFETVGEMPTGIVASTERCDVVAFDSVSGASVTLWDYGEGGGRELDCSETGLAYGDYSGTAEIAPGFINDIEWSAPQFVLVSFCCEPAAGRFEILDTTTGQQDWLAVDGSYPAIDDQNRLLFVRADMAPIGSIASVSFDVFHDKTDRANQYYQLQGDPFRRDFAQGIGDATSSLIGPVSWVDAPNLAFQLLVKDEQQRSSWVGYLNSEHKITLNSRGRGWTLPAGDQFGNLVVAEQQCTELLRACDGSRARIVVVDPPQLAPVYEVEINGAVTDMDLVRGWLLVTLADGRMGSLDLADGTFNVIAQGIRNAVWRE